MAETRIVTGCEQAWVNLLGRPGTLFVEGDALPVGVDAAELERLDGLGVFGPHPRDDEEMKRQYLIASNSPLAS